MSSRSEEELDADVQARLKAGRLAQLRREAAKIPAPRDLSGAPVLLEIRGLTVYYNKKAKRIGDHALKDVSLSVREGEFIYVMGRNGHGKSTLLDILSGRSKAKRISGKIFVGGIAHDFSDKGGFFSRKKSQLSIPHLKIWDEDDHNNQGMLGETFREQAQISGQPHLIVSHQDMPGIFNHADRIVYLRKGEIIWNDTAQNTFHAYLSEKLPAPMMKLINKAVKQQGWNLQLSEMVFSKKDI